MSYKQSAEQKALETRRNELQAERKVLVGEIADKQQISAVMKKKIGLLHKKIESIKEATPKKIIVSEHAMLRYLERVRGIDLQEIADIILTEKSVKVVQEFGDCKINTENGFKIIVKNNSVVTVSTKLTGEK